LRSEALGYATGLWTAGRVRELIEYQCGVRYHEAHVWRILRRDEEAIATGNDIVGRR
jgi:transposase